MQSNNRRRLAPIIFIAEHTHTYTQTHTNKKGVLVEGAKICKQQKN